MDNQQARFILQAYRPGGQDAGDPAFAEALEQSRRDPELAAWLDRERALDAAIAAKLKQAAAPAGLKDSILAGQKIIRPAARWSRPQLLAAAAAIAILLTVAGAWFAIGGGARIAALQRHVLAVAENHGGLDFYNADAGQVRDWVKSHVAVEYVIPEKMRALPGFGCRCLDWRGKRLAMVCFQAEGGRLVHLFVIKNSDLPRPPSNEVPVLEQKGEWALATWRRGETTYLLAGAADKEFLRKFL